MRRALTTAFVESVKPSDGVRMVYRDAKLKSFSLRVSPGGNRT